MTRHSSTAGSRRGATATALTAALNVSYMADQLALFGSVVGIALLLTGIGFGVFAAGLLGQRPRTVSEVGAKPVAAPVALA